MRSGLNLRSVLGLARTALDAVRRTSQPKPKPTPKPKPKPKPTPTPPRSPAGSAPSAIDIELDGTRIEYTPSMDGDPDPGEVVWTWVPYEDDPTQGKDRPVVIVGRRRGALVGVALTSKRNDREPQCEVGTGPWDREGRPSYAKLERVLEIDPRQVRREGAVLDRRRFDDLVVALGRVHGTTHRDR